MTDYSLKVADIISRSYPGGEITVERQLEDGEGYTKWNISYPSDGLKIHGLLAIPKDEPPTNGWPMIIFNRGYVDPAEYGLDKQYLRYIDYLVKAGFMVFKSDYRGIGQSEGVIESVLTSANTTDILNGVASLQHSEYPIDWDRVFIWGHSMGGLFTLQCLLANSIFKAAAIWSGFMIPFADVLDRWNASPLERQRDRAKELINRYGSIDNPIWHQISPFYYLKDLPCKVQLHHGLEDTIVPESDSQRVHDELENHHKSGGLILYQNGGHNLNGVELPEAMFNTINFFNKI